MANPLQNWLENRAEILIVGAFSVAFIIGFALFAATGSLELAAAAIGIGAIGVPALLRQILPDKSAASKIPSFESRIKFLESALQTSEIRLVALENKAPQVTVADIERVALKISALEDRLASLNVKTNDRAAPPLKVDLPNKTLRLDEASIRNALGAGQIKIDTVDIQSKLTGHFAYRFIEMKCNDKEAGALSESDLRAARVSDELIKFFDRVRLALTYNMALQDAPLLDAPIHLCALGNEILADPQGVADIRSVMERSASIKQKIGLVLPSKPLDHVNLPLPSLIKSLQQAGFLVGLNVTQNFMAAPSDLVRLNPNFVLLSGDLIIEALRRPAQLAIHPADLIALFERGGIDLIAIGLASPEHVKAAEALGIHFSERSGSREMGRSQPMMPNKVRQAQTDLKSIFEDHHADDVMPPIELRPTSLRERLQRRSA